MANIQVENEREMERGWAFEVRVRPGGEGGTGGPASEHSVTLSWVDYDHWSRGQTAPAKVVEALFRFLCARQPAMEIAARFDAAAVRRRYPEVDRLLAEELE